jgi:hypothetical protein
MGWSRQPGDPHAEGPAAPARESSLGRGRKTLFYPPTPRSCDHARAERKGGAATGARAAQAGAA